MYSTEAVIRSSNLYRLLKPRNESDTVLETVRVRGVRILTFVCNKKHDEAVLESCFGVTPGWGWGYRVRVGVGVDRDL